MNIRSKKMIIPFTMISLIVMALIILTLTTNFNLSGYTYQINADMMTVEVGMVQKETFHLPTTIENSELTLNYMLLVQKADRLWGVNITIIVVLLIGVFLMLSNLPTSKRKYFKWYLGVSTMVLALILIWNINAYQELIEQMEYYIVQMRALS